MSTKDPSSPRPPSTLDQMDPPEPGMAHGPRTGDDLALDPLIGDPSSTDPGQGQVRAARSPESPWVGKTLGGRYEIFGVVGKGGAGHVFRAVQQPLGRVVAVKVLRTDLTPAAQKTFGDRFLREAALAGRLAHPALVTVHDYGQQDEDADGVPAGTRWVVMELLEGRTLWHRIRQEGCIPPREAARIAAALARGLRHAHSNGLVHRDVKPNNVVLVADDDGVEQPKLVDFGLVKPAAGEGPLVTEVGQYMGTPAYMAPEQADGRDVDGRADQYALGCVLYHMLSGVVPFEGNTPLGIAVQHKTDAVPPISRRSGVAVAPALEVIVRRSMAKGADDRYADCGAMADALEAWLQGLEAPVRPARRWPLAIGAAAALLLVVGAGGVALVAGLARGAGLAVGVLTGATEEPVAGEVEGMPTEVQPATDDGLADADDEPVVEPVAEEDPVAGEEPVAEEDPPVEEPVDAPPEPRPAPPPTPPPAPAPAPTPAPALTPAPAPAAPAPAPAPAGSVVFDDVAMSPEDARAAVAWINGATPEQLEAAGVYRRGVEVVLENRPFADMEAFAATRMIGTKTVEAALRGAGRL